MSSGFVRFWAHVWSPDPQFLYKRGNHVTWRSPSSSLTRSKRSRMSCDSACSPRPSRVAKSFELRCSSTFAYPTKRFVLSANVARGKRAWFGLCFYNGQPSSILAARMYAKILGSLLNNASLKVDRFCFSSTRRNIEGRLFGLRYSFG